MTKISAGGWHGWFDRLAARYPQRIVTKIIAGPAGAGWRWLPAWYPQIILTKIIAGGWLGWLDRRWGGAGCLLSTYQMIMTKIIAGGLLGWLDRLAAWYPERIVTKISAGPAGAG